MFARLILILFALVAVGLYIRVILPPEPPSASPQRVTDARMTGQRRREPASQSPPVPANTAVGMRAVEATSEKPEGQVSEALEPLPGEQMRLVIETLAPELMPKKP